MPMSKRLVGPSAFMLALLAAGVVSSARAEDRGSPEDQLACTPDVYRLCSSYVPDEDAIVACLRRNLRALSPACHKVMARHDATPAPASGDQDTD
jgi:hypothetical protein